MKKLTHFQTGGWIYKLALKKKKACTGLNQSLKSTKFFKLINVARYHGGIGR